MISLTVTAPIKLNLNLHIIGVTSNHYHLLEGVTVFATDGDNITITHNHSDTDDLIIQGQFAHFLNSENPSDNLIIKAIKLLRTIKDFPFLTLTLEKNIPIQAGYGGGSSDAAAVLKGINQLCDLNISHHDLMMLGKSLGADVPMCVYAKPCLIHNVGDVITPLNIQNKTYMCLLLKPDFMLATQQVFHALTHKNNPKMAKTDNPIHYALHDGRNDLFQAALHLQPKLNHYLQALLATHPIKAAMSGSGSGLFALYDNQDAFESAYDTIKKQFSENFILKTSINL